MTTALTRQDDHQTSLDAAKKVAEQLRPILKQVYLTLAEAGDNGLTDSELRAICDARYLKRPESTYRKRRSELVAMGMVEAKSGKRLNQSQCWETVFRVTGRGLEEILIPKRGKRVPVVKELQFLRSAVLSVYSDLSTCHTLRPATVEKVKAVYAEVFG
jgi:hypothetical protein